MKKKIIALLLSIVMLNGFAFSYTASAENETVKYTTIEEGINFNDADGIISESTAVYGLSEKIPAKSGDTFKVSCVQTWQWGSKAVAAAYDSKDNYLGPIVHNIISRGDKYMQYTGRGIISATDSNGSSKSLSAYSLGLWYSSKNYYSDITFQIPDSTNEKSLFYGISYIRVRAFNYLPKEDFYVEYLGNTDPNPDTGIRHLPEENEEGLSDTLGDLDGNGDVSISDILYLRKYLAKYQNYTADIGNADFNFDGKINLKDVAYFRRNLANYDGYEIKNDQKFIALSFDDSPGTVPTAVMKKYTSQNVRGTFMLSATRMYPDSDYKLNSIVSLGYDLGNHTSFHNFLGNWADSEIYNEVNWTQDLIYEKTGQTTKYFRPPYFTVNKHLSDSLSDMVFIKGTGSSDTSTNVTAEQSAATQLSQAKDGNIILLHDNSKLGDTLDILIPALLEKGYVICTIDELFQYKHITPKAGCIYTNVLSPETIS